MTATLSFRPKCLGVLALLTFPLLLILLAAAEARTWTSVDGSKTFEGDLKSYNAETGEVTVNAKGKTMSFKQEMLSAEDIEFLKSAPAPAAAGSGSAGTSAAAKTVPAELPDPDGEEADMTQPVQVFILMGQSNMLGFGKVAGGDGSVEGAAKAGKYPFLVDEAGAWTTRKDVRNVRVMNFKDHKNDWLTCADTKAVGPEIGIGTVLGEALDAPVLILKSCIGNRSLGWDLLPPGSEQFEEGGKVYAGYKDSPDSWAVGSHPKPISWYAGKQYDDDTASAKQVLESLDKYYPGAKDYEIAGFVFWQGAKDCGNAVHAAKYEENLVRFIKALREDFEAPGAKFVTGTLGQTKEDAGGNEGLVLKAQMAVDGEAGNYDEFKGNVASVYCNPHCAGGSANSHYGGNANTYMDVGLALGRAMAGLLAK